MPVAVADTTPLRYLTEIGHLDLLPRLLETIFIPPVVYQELQHPGGLQIVLTVLFSAPAWLKIVPTEVADDDRVLIALDDGEKAALTLGVNVGAGLILLDERKGAAAARIKGLEFTVTLGILIRASQRQWIDLAEFFARARQTKFYSTPSA
jgi:uncharacterized protein